MIRRTLLLAGAALTVACASEDPEIRHQSAAPVFEGQIDLEIGEIDGADEYLFDVIGGVTADSAGRIYVADMGTHDVRVFDPNGQILFSFGGEGDGPGELRAPCCLAWSPDGLLWVRETGSARYSGFRPSVDDVTFEKTIRSRHGGANVFRPVTFDRRGRLVDVGMLPAEGDGRDVARTHLGSTPDSDSTELIKAPSPKEVGLHTVSRDRSTSYLWQPYGPQHLLADGPGGSWAQALSSSYEVELHDGLGGIVLIKGPETPGSELTSTERARGEQEIESQSEASGIPRRDVPYGVPDRKPPLRGLAFDQDGRLWVERYAEGERREADVYDVSGALAASYEWEGDVRVGSTGWIGRGHMLGMRRDSPGVQRVARVRFDLRR